MLVLLNISTLCSDCATSFTTCCLALVVVHGIPASSSATCTVVIVVRGFAFLSIRYSCCWLMRKGIIQSLFLCAVGMLGMPRAVQKSSANWPERYPCLVMGANSPVFTFSLPLSVAGSPSAFLSLQTNVFVGVDISGVLRV